MPKVARNFLIAAIVLFACAAGLPHLLPISDWLSGMLYGFGAGCLLGALFGWFAPDACDAATPTLRRRYLREFLPPMAAYVVLVFLSVWLLKRVDAPALRTLVALMPVPPIAFALRAIMRYIRDADELQRRIELEAVAFSSAFVSFAYLTGGFLQAARVIEVRAADAMLWVFPLTCLAYGVVKIVVSRRYR
ncbi:MAG TPA: hypothetical protein VFI26_02685 [Lysobacter sp.]|nr:hypothetical protein [Lysobacter sp.]